MPSGYIQSRNRFDECVVVGSSENDLHVVSKKRDQAQLDRLPLIGFYGETGGHKGCLYRWQGELRVRIDDGLPIPVIRTLSVSLVRSGREARFSLHKSGDAIVSFQYQLPSDVVNIEDDPTPCIEAEDFDFFLFIRNVLTDPSRQDRMFR
jgi:hypothetical protein